MKKLLLPLIAAVIGTTCSFSQINTTTHPLTGMWQYATTIKMKDGRDLIDRKQIYKIINSDNSYSVLTSVKTDIPKEENVDDWITQMESTVLSQKGTYEIESDSVYTEFVTNHYMNKALTVTTSKMKYKFCDKAKNILRIECYNESLGRWISELWTRVVPAHENAIILE